eukprot:354877_1
MYGDNNDIIVKKSDSDAINTHEINHSNNLLPKEQKHASRMISLSSDSGSEYKTFMKTIENGKKVFPEYQPLIISNKFHGSHFNEFAAEIEILEKRKQQ